MKCILWQMSLTVLQMSGMTNFVKKEAYRNNFENSVWLHIGMLKIKKVHTVV